MVSPGIHIKCNWMAFIWKKKMKKSKIHSLHVSLFENIFLGGGARIYNKSSQEFYIFRKKTHKNIEREK